MYMKGRNNIWYCNIKEFVLFKYISQGEIHMVL